MKLPIGRGRIYTYDDVEDKYRYSEENEVWNPGRLDEVGAKIEEDDTRYDLELSERLRRIREASNPEINGLGPNKQEALKRGLWSTLMKSTRNEPTATKRCN